ncbi:MAG TPA: DNA glycosylase [Chloroflexota bacterium]|nr:DNA glycosylase [Chloroflexota bacterium]
MDFPAELSWDDVATVDVPLGAEALDLAATLDCGQAFRWSADETDQKAWVGVLHDRAYRLQILDGGLSARVFPDLPRTDVVTQLRRYFALDVRTESILSKISAAHPSAAAAVNELPGLRVLRQPASEALLSFAIASATNVPRIRRSISRMSACYGQPIGRIDGRDFLAFPSAESLATAPSADLSGPCNLAYRASHLQNTARVVIERGNDWLEGLAQRSYLDAHTSLDELPHIGPKIADCICLFGLGFHQAVPVDVHVWAIARDLFGDRIPTQTLTPATYRAVGDMFREMFGPHAGWAQQYLFTARRARPRHHRPY